MTRIAMRSVGAWFACELVRGFLMDDGELEDGAGYLRDD